MTVIPHQRGKAAPGASSSLRDDHGISDAPLSPAARLARAGLMVIALMLGLATPASALTLTVRALGVKPHKGVLRACLWDGPGGFPDCEHHASVANTSGPAEEGGALRFENIPPGVYAVSMMQDLDSDGHLRTNFLGVPKEPVGLSNNPVLIRIPPPGWNDVKITLVRDTVITIRLANFK